MRNRANVSLLAAMWGMFLAFLAMLLLVNASVLSQAPATPAQNDSIKAFWGRFRAAVIKGDKAAVADMSQFPISMPYGMAELRNRAQLIRRYRDVFNHEGSAAKCFVDARQETDPARPREFTVPCKNSAGDEVVIYSFERTRNGWRFKGLDNINE